MILALVILFSLQNSKTCFAEKKWYQDHERGWFWYELIPEAPPEEPKEPEKQEAPIIVSTPSTQEPQPPPPLSAEWFKENLQKYQEIAIDNPTPENVAAFLYLQRVMLDKSQRFAEQVKHVVQMDALLDQGSRRPLAEYAGVQYSKEVRENRKRLMREIAGKAGIFFFFQGGCGQCEIQAPVLKSLNDLFGFVVFPISINGMPLKNKSFPEYETDKGQAHGLNVFQTPAMFLGKPSTREIIPLAQSAMSRDQLEERILVAAKDAGWITEEEYNSTRGFNADMALNLSHNSIPDNINDEKLINYIKELYKRRTKGLQTTSSADNNNNCEGCKIGN